MRSSRPVDHRDIPFVRRLKSEVEFLAAAIYGILTMARTIQRLAAGEVTGVRRRGSRRVQIKQPLTRTCSVTSTSTQRRTCWERRSMSPTRFAQITTLSEE